MGSRFDLTGKIAIVTGSEGDIGKAIVQGLEEQGAIVYGFDKKEGDDITRDAICEKVADIGNIHKHIDILVNNAGLGGFKWNRPFEHYPEYMWDEIIKVNLKAVYQLSKVVIKYMKEKGGSIINITSVWAERGLPYNIAYGASKGGLKQLSKCMAYELAQYNIRVNNIGFGYIKSGMTQKSWDDEDRRRFIANLTMLKRWGFPEDVKGAVIFLASVASNYITAQDIYIDGGRLAKGI